MPLHVRCLSLGVGYAVHCVSVCCVKHSPIEFIPFKLQWFSSFVRTTMIHTYLTQWSFPWYRHVLVQFLFVGVRTCVNACVIAMMVFFSFQQMFSFHVVSLFSMWNMVSFALIKVCYKMMTQWGGAVYSNSSEELCFVLVCVWN